MADSSDPGELRQMRPVDIDSALDHIFLDNPQILEQLQSDSKLVSVMVGLAMKALRGAADPSVISQKIRDRL